MDANEATTIVLSKIKGIDPDNASKIMGYLLIQDLTEKDIIRLAFGPETLLHGLILKAKSQLGLHSPSPRTSLRYDLDSALSPFSNNVVRHGAASPSSLSLSGGGGGSRAGSPFFSPPFNAGGGGPGDLGENSEYFSFLSDNGGKSGEGVEMDGHYLHKRSYSESDVGFGYEDSGGESNGGGGCCRPCLYFARGFCKNGSNCKFLHGHGGGCGGDDLKGGSYSAPPVPFVGSPGGFDHEELMRLKVAHQKRLAAAAATSQFMPGMSPPSPQGKYFNMLLQQQQQQNDAPRFPVPGMAAGDAFYKYRRYQPERGDFLAMGLADKANSASRQIYLTFPADSAFKDEDVSEYFSKYGPVQDVRIPYQQKRMFGFVTFVYLETVRLILAKGNPHFICDSRVLVKPYKEKGKVPEKRQQQPPQQLFEMGDFLPSSSFLPLDPVESYDHPGARGFHNSHEAMLRRKLEGQANLQQAIEMHGRRLLNLQLPALKDDSMHHHMRSLSLSSPISPSIHPRGQFSPTVVPFNVFSRDAPEDCWNRPAVLVSSSAEEHCRSHVNMAALDNILADERNGDNPSLNGCDSQGRNSFDHILPDSLFASPTKSSADHHSDYSELAEADADANAAGDLIEKIRATEIQDAPVTPTMNNPSSGKKPLSSH